MHEELVPAKLFKERKKKRFESANVADPGHIFESLKLFFWVKNKIFKNFVADLESGMRDGKNSDSGHLGHLGSATLESA
jgi:hypothetical protein